MKFGKMQIVEKWRVRKVAKLESTKVRKIVKIGKSSSSKYCKVQNVTMLKNLQNSKTIFKLMENEILKGLKLHLGDRKQQKFSSLWKVET